jgi:hypothetical protein
VISKYHVFGGRIAISQVTNLLQLVKRVSFWLGHEPHNSIHLDEDSGGCAWQ